MQLPQASTHKRVFCFIRSGFCLFFYLDEYLSILGVIRTHKSAILCMSNTKKLLANVKKMHFLVFRFAFILKVYSALGNDTLGPPETLKNRFLFTHNVLYMLCIGCILIG